MHAQTPQSNQPNSGGAPGGGTTPGSLGIQASVSFGVPRGGGGPCLGKGMCRMHSTEPTAIDVKFSRSDVDNEIFMMSFSLADLTANQPDQLQWFNSPSKTYQFDQTYKLDDQVFASLGLLVNPRIEPQSPTSVVIMGDMVLTVIKYAHD